MPNRDENNISLKWHKSRNGEAVASRGYYTITNAMLANIIEFGKSSQPPKPFMKPAEKSSKNVCIKVMEAKFNEEIENL